MVIARLYSHVTGVVAAVAITLGLITAPAPAARTLAEPAVAVQTLHLEVATVGLETALADVMTGVVDAAKTVALIVLSPILVPLAFLSIGFTLGGTGICVSTGCEAEWQNPSWVAGKIFKAVWSFLRPSTLSPAAVMAPARTAAVTGDAPTAPAAAVVADTPVRVAPPREARGAAVAARTDVTPAPGRAGALRSSAAKTVAPAAATVVSTASDTAAAADEVPTGRSGKAASQRGRGAATR